MENRIFLMGLLSLIDAMLETPMQAVLGKNPAGRSY
jgi:c-di-GMP-related signal transduction protein